MSHVRLKGGQVRASIKCCGCGSEVRYLFTEDDIDQGIHRVCPHCGQGLVAARVYNCNLGKTSYITAPGTKTKTGATSPEPKRKEIRLPRF